MITIVKQNTTIKLIILLAFSGLFVCTLSCKRAGEEENSYKPQITGTAGEVTLVMDKSLWKSSTGSRLKQILQKEVPCLPREEPMFDIRYIPMSSFSNFFHTKRNIIRISVSENFNKPDIAFKKNVWARTQLLIDIKAPDTSTLSEFLNGSEAKIINSIKEEERKRIRLISKSSFNKDLSGKLKKVYGINLRIPNGFSFFKEDKHFIWIGNEKTDFKQYIFIYFYNYKNTDSLSLSFFLDKRDSIMKKNVQGIVPGSYMTTERKFKTPVILEHSNKGEKMWELRGLWKMQDGDFMGGSFISFSISNQKYQRMITAEAFLYHPNSKHRNTLDYLESFIRDLKIED